MARKPRGDASPTAPERVANRIIDGRTAAQLRAAGASFRDIAEQLGCSVSRAHGLVIEQLDLVAYENVNLMRTQEGERLDRLQRALWAKALNANAPGQTAAVREIVRIMERRARLFGLDAPITVEAELSVGDQVSADRLTERLETMRMRMQAIDTTVVDDVQQASG